MPETDPNLKAIVLGELQNSPEWESRTANAIKERAMAYRNEQGWEGPGQYRGGSWLHKRWIASRRWENDFSDRAGKTGLYSLSNMSLNMPASFIAAHHASIIKDLLSGDTWFDVAPEGAEDADPAIKLWGRYLQRVAKDKDMQSALKAATLGVMIRGEQFFKATDKVVVMWERRDVRVVIAPDAQGVNQPIKDTRGGFVTELDQWVAMPGDPSKQVLLRDAGVVMDAPYPTPPALSITLQSVMVQTNPSQGCDFASPYWGDMIFPLTDPDIRQSDLTGQVFDKCIDDLVDMFDPALRVPATFDAYCEACMNSAGTQILSDQSTALRNRGEEDRKIVPGEGAFSPRRYAEIWARVETTEIGTPAKDRRREDTFWLFDITDDDWRPLTYDYKRNVAPWLTDRRNPFGVIRINPVANRCYGMGYYEAMRDVSEVIDKNENRVEVAIGTSGNIVHRDRTATDEGMAGMPLEYRSTRVYSTVAGRDASESVHVTNVPCDIKEIEEARDHALARIQNEYGITSPEDAESSGLPAANTLGGMQILEKQASTRVRTREGEILGGEKEGLVAAIRDFSRIEAHKFDRMQAEKIFAPLKSAQDAAAQEQAQAIATGQPPQPIDPAMVPADNAAVLGQWIAKAGEHIDNFVTMQIADKTSSTVISQAQQAIQVGTQWETFGVQFGPDAQERWQDVFALILSKLDVPNPKSALKLTTPPPQQPIAPNGQPQQPSAAAGPGPTTGGVVTPPPQPLSPPQPGQGLQ